MKVVLENLTKTFPGRSKKDPAVTAVNNFNIEIPDGKLIGLLGPSGCGKSTALNLLSGLLKPTAGRIYFGEEDVTDIPPEKRGIGLVFQNYALYPHLTVIENILFPLENLKGEEKLSCDEMMQRAMEAARLVQIEMLLNRKPKELSGGQQQRVAIARALVKMPRLLLLDEPLSNLDARLRLQTREEISRIQKETGITTIFVTHDQEEAMSISDQIIVMKDGVIQQIGQPQEVYDDPKNLFVAEFLGTPQINTFEGEIKDGKLFIGDEAVLNIKGAANQKVYVAVRPEAFIPDANGPLSCKFKKLEIMGRDVSIVFASPYSERKALRAIISADTKVEPMDGIIRFFVRSHKTEVFNFETKERVYYEEA